MKCEFDNEITLKALNLLHRDILLGDAEAQEVGIGTLVQLVRYFARRSGQGTLAEEAENLERTAVFLTAGGELRQCVFPDPAALPVRCVERFSVFSACYEALRRGIRGGEDAFCVQYDEAAETLAVKVMEQP